MIRRLLLLTATVVASSAGAGCGGAKPAAIPAPSPGQPVVGLVATTFGVDAPPDPGSAHEEIARAAGAIALSGDTETCKENYNPGVLLLSGPRCMPSPGIEVLRIRLGEGLDNATATIVHHGGPLDGVTGTWVFVKVKSDNPPGLKPDHRWVVATWDADYAKSFLLAETGPQHVTRGPDDPLDNPKVQACVRPVVKKLSVNGVVDWLFQEHSYATGTRLAAVMKCSYAAGTSPAELRREYALELSRLDDAAWAGARANRCAVEGLIGSWDDPMVVREATTNHLDLGAEVSDRVQACIDR